MTTVTSALPTKPCRRCRGSGRYSFNLMDMDRCYGCGGTGRVLATPKGQKAIKPTCADYREAKVGDILKHGPLYRVEEIRWIRLLYRKPRGWTNQQLRLLRLVDSKTVYMTRLYEKMTKLPPRDDGGTREVPEMVEPTPEMIGQLVEV